MINQREIAEALGVNQSTVSLALRGSKRVAPALRRKIRDTAKQMGYTPNPSVNAVMARIRSGKKISGQGVIALMIAAKSMKEWYEIETYRIFHQGVIQRGMELGYRVENFFLAAPDMDCENLDKILTARGISGIIFAPPYYGNRRLKLNWDHYAAVGIGFGREEQDLNRVVYDSLQSFTTAFHELQKLGYRRIGVIIHQNMIIGSRHGIKWYTAYLDCQNDLPKKNRIPVFPINSPDPPWEPWPSDLKEQEFHNFQHWLSKWKPDALLTTIGEEISWLKALNIEVSRDIGVACLALPKNSSYAGINEKSDVIGATAIEWVAGQIAQNDLGLPAHQKTMMVEGVWVWGETVKSRTRTSADEEGEI
ncbi:LacI family DNA-binding transcriptional regulator [Kiritimatiellaeota bacterium B1221]|nr:LacI family DNA-binding transcriptional regulator [Kiritimatiellaeota bacterium B1221]